MKLTSSRQNEYTIDDANIIVYTRHLCNGLGLVTSANCVCVCVCGGGGGYMCVCVCLFVRREILFYSHLKHSDVLNKSSDFQK